MSSTALRATTSRTWARRASTVGATMVVIAFAASVSTGGVAQAASGTQGTHASFRLSVSIGDKLAPERFPHPDCGVCIL